MSEAPINTACPRSGKPVVADALARYRGYVVGFCNSGCRDDFEGNVEARPDDRQFFDELIADFDQKNLGTSRSRSFTIFGKEPESSGLVKNHEPPNRVQNSHEPE